MTTFSTINPATEEHLKTYRLQSSAHIETSLKQAAHAFQQWKNIPVSDRARHFANTARLLKKRKDFFAETMTIEMGKPIIESKGEIEKCAWLCHYFAEQAASFLQPETVKTENKKSYVRFDPLGVVLAIMPWNFPFWQVFRCAAPALCAGNAILLKHSNQVPQCSLELQNLFLEAGFPEGIFTSLLINAGQVQAVIPKVEAVSLTGSVEAGRSVAEKAGRHLKKVVLELGGSDPFLVLDDADLSLACQQAINGRFLNSGQSCIAAKRFIVTKKQSKDFTEQAIRLVADLIVGDPLDRKTQVGPLANLSQLTRLEKQIASSVRAGAKKQAGGNRLKRKGYFFEPTVMTRLKKTMPLIREEVFGPVLPILVVKNNGEALHEANDSRYGLGASIWTPNVQLAERMAERLEAGNVAINSIVKSDPRLPFGGIKESGIGRELSRYGILEFTNIKSVVVQ